MLCLAVLAAVLAPCASARSVIDLSGTAIADGELVAIEGKWEFYWHEFITPGQKPLVDPLLVDVPGSWDRYQSKTGERFPAYGYASFRTLLKLPTNTPQNLALKIRRVKMAHTVLANGVVIARKGTPAESRSGTVNEHSPYIVSVPSTLYDDEIELIFHVSNYTYIKSGLNQSILIGRYEAAIQKRERSLFVSTFLGGSLFMIALYHFVFWYKRRTDKAALFFGLFCLGISLRMLVTGETYALVLMPQVSTEALLSVELFSVYFSLPMLHILVHALFKEEFRKTDPLSLFKQRLSPSRGKWMSSRALSIAVLAVLSGVVVATPLSVHGKMIPYFEMYVVYILIHIVAIAVLAVSKRQPGSVLFLVGFLALFATGINDILHERSIINTAYFFHVGVFAFVFAQSSLLSMRIASTFNELEDLKHSLERKVRDRTEELAKLSQENRLLSRSVTTALESERKYIAKEMHDGVNAYIIGAKLQLEHLANQSAKELESPEIVSQRLRSLVERLGEIYEKTRNVVRRLRPETFDALGLKHAMIKELNDYDRIIPNCSIEHQIDDSVDSVSEEKRITLYRITQEAMTNIIKHAKATRVFVDLTVSKTDVFVLVIEDNGAGFNESDQKGIGLISMRERALSVGGTFTITSTAGGGTTIIVKIPGPSHDPL